MSNISTKMKLTDAWNSTGNYKLKPNKEKTCYEE